MGIQPTTIEDDPAKSANYHTDADLLEDVRNGRSESYRQLYERHYAAAYNLARRMGGSQADWDDRVSEAFMKVLDAVLSGKTVAPFRAYLLTTLRHLTYDNTRRGKKCSYVDDVTQAQGVRPERIVDQYVDPVTAKYEKSVAAAAFKTLPERWRKVLAYTEIAGMTPAEAAPIFGLTANGLSALAYRAREALKQAYLQAHIRSEVATKCKATATRLGAAVRDGLTRRAKENVAAHLDECASCRARLGDLAEVNSQIR